MVETDSRLQNIWQDLPVGVMLMTQEHVPHVIAMNSSALQLYGYENAEEVRNLPVTGIFDDPLDLAHLFVSLQTEGSVLNRICRHRKKDGSILWASVSASRVTEKDGSSFCSVAVQDATEQKRQENNFESGKREWETVFDTMTELTILTDPNHRILQCNRATSLRLGKSYQDIIGQDIITLFFGEDPPDTDPFALGSREVQIPKLAAYFLVTSNPIRSAVTIRGLVHVMMDITERKKSEDLIREREVLYRTMAEGLPLGTYIAQDGCFQWINQRFSQNTGYGEEDILGQPCLSFVHPDDRASVKENAIAMLHGAGTLPYGYRFLAKDGSLTWNIETVVSMFYNGRRAVLGSQMDITDRKKAEEALRISEDRYRSIIDTISDGYFELDLAGNNIFCNDQYLEIRGYSREEVQGLNFRQYVDKKNADLAYKAYNEVFRTGKPAKHLQLEWTTKDGRRKIVNNSVSLIRDAKGRPIGFRGISRDVTTQRQNEIQELHSQKLESVGQLAAGIAHEINTPIQFVGDNIHFMQDAFQDILSLHAILVVLRNIDTAVPPVVRDLIDRIQQKEEEIDMGYLGQEIPKAIHQSLDGLQRVSKIVQAMREFSHPGGEGMSDLNINRAIESTITLTRNEWKYAADLTTSLAPDLPIVKGYPADFNQVILNIIVNAAQALQEKVEKGGADKGRIEISTRQDGNEVEICIRDTGPGIPPEAQPRIFDPFFTTKEVGKGTGQGLTIAQNIIVRKHGGKIFFETTVGAGTSFYIRLPLEEE